MKIPERKDADKKYTWRTEDLFATDEIWEQHYNELDKKAGKIEELQNTCTKDAASLLECLKLYNDICEELDRIYVYAYMRSMRTAQTQNTSSYPERQILLR